MVALGDELTMKKSELFPFLQEPIAIKQDSVGKSGAQ
jgi:hypothetical protein